MVLMQSGLRNPDCKGTFLKILQGAREGHRVGKVNLKKKFLKGGHWGPNQQMRRPKQIVSLKVCEDCF